MNGQDAGVEGREAAERRARARSEERYALAVRAADEGIWDWDLAADRVYFSSRWSAILGRPEDAGEEDPSVWFDLVHDDDLLRLRAAIDAHLSGNSQRLEFEHRIRHADGSWRWVLCQGLAIRDPDGTATRIAGAMSDITERRREERRLQHDALHDVLTGLPNRALLTDRLDHLLQRTRRDPSVGCAILLLDVDQLKHVNERYSREIGDCLLRAIAGRLGAMLRPADTAAKIAGDQFALLLDGVVTERQANVVAERVERAIDRPFMVDGHELSITAGIGLAISDARVLAADLIGRAELAMYHAKQRGVAQRAVFDHGMQRRVGKPIVPETELRRAIEQSLLPVHYQPIVELATGRLRGLEALARNPVEWPDLAPLDLILAAEEIGMIGALGLHVLRTSLERLAAWRRQGIVSEGFRISVNISARQLGDPRLPAMLRAALAGAGLPADSLRLDITESAVLREPDLIRNVVGEVSAAGVSVHLDDFGTASSSLVALHRLPLEALKVDRTFVASLGHDHGTGEAIVRSSLAIAESLGLSVIAEGIEDAGQLQQLRALGCEYGQGYLFSRPRSADDMQTLLMSWSEEQVVAAGATVLTV